MDVNQDRPVIFLMGSTATGKTDLAQSLYDRFPVELISVDAAQVYRGMDIGTAKPEPAQLAHYPHHLIDIRSPQQPYSAADFAQDARRLIYDVHSRNKIPLLVGGTMFYFKALEIGLSKLPSADVAIRKQIEQKVSQFGISEIHRQLRQIDPVMADKIDPHDSQRIQRAMEIYQVTGESPSNQMKPGIGLDFPLIKLALFNPNRSALHQRIAERFDSMLQQGLIDEVRKLRASLPDREAFPSMRIVGYRQITALLREEIDYREMVEAAVAATRQLAKRQLTWLRQQSNLVWFGAETKLPTEPVTEYLQSCLEKHTV